MTIEFNQVQEIQLMCEIYNRQQRNRTVRVKNNLKRPVGFLLKVDEKFDFIEKKNGKESKMSFSIKIDTYLWNTLANFSKLKAILLAISKMKFEFRMTNFHIMPKMPNKFGCCLSKCCSFIARSKINWWLINNAKFMIIWTIYMYKLRKPRKPHI